MLLVMLAEGLMNRWEQQWRLQGMVRYTMTHIVPFVWSVSKEGRGRTWRSGCTAPDQNQAYTSAHLTHACPT